MLALTIAAAGTPAASPSDNCANWNESTNENPALSVRFLGGAVVVEPGDCGKFGEDPFAGWETELVGERESVGELTLTPRDASC
jgi:hypothetical protein